MFILHTPRPGPAARGLCRQLPDPAGGGAGLWWTGGSRWWPTPGDWTPGAGRRGAGSWPTLGVAVARGLGVAATTSAGRVPRLRAAGEPSPTWTPAKPWPPRPVLPPTSIWRRGSGGPGGRPGVVTRRVTDAPLVVGPAAWPPSDGAPRTSTPWPVRWWPATSSSAAHSAVAGTTPSSRRSGASSASASPGRGVGRRFGGHHQAPGHRRGGHHRHGDGPVALRDRRARAT